MSRSNPTEHAPHPCQRWHEWDGSAGEIYYYDKNEVNPQDPKKKGLNITVGKKFVFIVLDRLALVKGWHEPSESSIQSNEVRDTKAEALVVKARKGGILAEGFYANIRDRVKACGGKFTCNLYIAYKDGDGLKLGSLQFKGAALNAWVEFEKKNRDAIWKQAVKINGSTSGKKGAITFEVPKFSLLTVTEKTDTEAKALDSLLQVFLKNYFKRSRVEQVDRPHVEPSDNDVQESESVVEEAPEENDDVPF